MENYLIIIIICLIAMMLIFGLLVRFLIWLKRQTRVSPGGLHTFQTRRGDRELYIPGGNSEGICPGWDFGLSQGCRNLGPCGEFAFTGVVSTSSGWFGHSRYSDMPIVDV